MTRRLRTATVVMAVLLAAAGCGLEPQPAPQPIQPPDGLQLATPSQPPATSTGRVPEILYFVRAGMLVRVTRHVTTPASATRLLHDLLAGPSDTESNNGLTSSLLGTDTAGGITVTAGQAIVSLTSPLTTAASNDEVLAYAQIVCTLTALSTVDGVTFTSDGTPVAVPRADGSLVQSPLTLADYAGLVAPA